MPPLLPLLTVCLSLLASCSPKDAVPTLEGKWVAYSETEYVNRGSHNWDEGYEPFLVSDIHKHRLEITPDSFIFFVSTKASAHRMGAHSYRHLGGLIVVPESGQKFEVKVLTPDTLTLLYRTAADTSLRGQHVDRGFTYIR